ncbi:MAG: (2Fe-2S)-binding protein [Desulfurococcaceae archaeon]
MVRVSFRLNGAPVEVDVPPWELLINTLRERFGLTGTKYGCGIGECGACTVWIDGEPALSCLVLTVDVNGREVTTIEGISAEGPTPLQKALAEEGAIQCGFCTPGMVMMGEYLLRRVKGPSVDEIKEYLKGNICRCTGFINIVKAVLRASKERGS